jgi:hypothetical protein
MAASLPSRLSASAVLAVLGLTSVTASASVSIPGSASESRAAGAGSWQAVPGLELGHGQALTRVAWASGRTWLIVGSQAGLRVASARARGAALASFETTRVTAPLGWYPIVLGSDVLYSTTRSTSGIARLLPNGRVGVAEAASPEPMTPKVGVPVAAARVGGRIVWTLAGGVPVGQGGSYKPSLWVCCDDVGAARDLTSLITPLVNSPPRGHALGVDTQGRVWLAWHDGRVGRGQIRAVQLDPETLAPRTRKALAAPVTRPVPPSLATEQLALACTTACRLVLGSYFRLPSGGGGTRIVTWAPGERSVTPVDLPRDPGGAYLHPMLIASGFRGGKLAIAYSQDATEGRTLKVAVGDVRGRHPRPAGSVKLPDRSRGVQMYTFHAGAFGPSGFAFAQTYSDYGTRGHVLATVVPLR